MEMIKDFLIILAILLLLIDIINIKVRVSHIEDQLESMNEQVVFCEEKLDEIEKK